MDELLNNNDIELIINLTIPSAHKEIIKKTLEAGKHSFSDSMKKHSSQYISKSITPRGCYAGIMRAREHNTRITTSKTNENIAFLIPWKSIHHKTH